MNALTQVLRGLGAARLAAMVGVAAGLLGFFVYVSTRLDTADMTLLYADLEIDDSGQIVDKLESLGVPYELRGDGSQILVPGNQVLRLRMSMAQEGLPTGGAIGYEIFDRTTSFGTTNFVQQINYVRALEGELGRTIRSLDQIMAARVHLVMPQRELFSRNERQPSASIVLKMRGASTLTRAQTQAIQHLTAAAVPGLNPGHISIIDDSGTLLARGLEDDAAADQAVSSLREMREAYENRVRRAVETLLERSVGPGNVRAEVSAEMDFDRVTTNAEIFDPDGQVVRSAQFVEEVSKSAESEGATPVSVSGNLPEAQVGDQLELSNRSDTTRTEETTNYEISRTLKTEVHESGTVKRLSVAVLVNGTYQAAVDGSKSYAPRGEEELDQLATLVKLAIGYDEARGDKVEVVNLRFAEPEPLEVLEDDAAFLDVAGVDLFRIAQILVLGLVAALVLLLVVRPVVARALTMPPAGQLPAPVNAGADQLAGGAQTAIAGPEGAGQSGVAAPPPEEGSLDSLIDLERVEGQVRASSVRKVSELVEKHPEETIAIMRQWLYQDA